MNDLEHRLHDQLVDLASRMPDTDLAQSAVIRGRRVRRLRAAGTAIAAAGVAIVVTVIALLVPGNDSSPKPLDQLTGTPSPRTDERSAPSSQFEVTAPLLFPFHGPAPLPHPPCRLSDLNPTGKLLTTVNGVMGVVNFHGNDCRLPLGPGPVALLDSDGKQLDVPVRANSQVGANPRPDLAFSRGDSSWGFAWTGSWCGEPAAAVEFRLTDDPGTRQPQNLTVTAPLVGPQLSCAGTSDAVLVPGAAGSPDDGVLPPPAAWSNLHATLHAPSASDGTTLTNLSVTLRNDGNDPVAIDPCPRFALTVETTVDGPTGGQAMTGTMGTLPCTGPLTVPAGAEHDFVLPSVDVSEAPKAGTDINVRFAIAGVPATAAVIPVR